MIYRGFEIRPHNNNPKSLLITHYGKAGKIPKLLEGLFTDKAVAKQVIDLYLDTKAA